MPIAPLPTLYLDNGQSALCFCRWKHGILSFHGVAELSNEEWFTQLPFIVVVAVFGGLLGAAFNWMHERIFAVFSYLH